MDLGFEEAFGIYRGKPEEIVSHAADRVARMTLDLIKDVEKVKKKLKTES